MFSFVLTKHSRSSQKSSAPTQRQWSILGKWQKSKRPICQASLSDWGRNWRSIVLWPHTATIAKVFRTLRNNSQPAERIQSGRAHRGETYLLLGGMWHKASQRLAGKCIVRKRKHRPGSAHRQKSSHKLRGNSFSSEPKDLQ